MQLSLQAVHHLTFSLIDWHTFDESGSETIRPQTKQHPLRAAKNETGGLENAERVIKRVFKEDERRPLKACFKEKTLHLLQVRRALNTSGCSFS